MKTSIFCLLFKLFCILYSVFLMNIELVTSQVLHKKSFIAQKRNMNFSQYSLRTLENAFFYKLYLM